MAQKYSIYAVFKMQDMVSPGMRRMMTNMSNFGKSANRVGKNMSTKLSAPIALFGGAVIKTAVDFDTSMNKVEARSGATGDALMSMRKEARHLGATTAFSASQAADAMAFLAQAGWDTQKILAGTPAILDLAAASGTDLAMSADIASNIMGAFNIKAGDASRVADVLSAATSSANVDLEMLGETMKYAGPVANQFGLSLEDTAAAAGLLGNIGIQGSMAGTAIKNSLLQLTNPASDASKMLEKLGVKTMDAAGNMLPFADIMAEFGNKLNGLGSGTQLKAINMLFGKISMAGASELIKQAKSGELQKYADQLGHVEGKARSMAEIMLKGAPGAVKEFASAFEGMMISIAKSGLLEWFSQILRGLTGFISKISQSNPAILKWGSVIAIGVAAAGPLVMILGAVASGLAALISPIGLVVAGIAALAVGAVLVYQNWDKISAFFIGKFDAIKNAFKSGLLDGMLQLFKEFNPFTLMYEAIDGLISYFTGFDLSGWFSNEIAKITAALPGWMKTMLGIDENASAAAKPSRPASSQAVRNVVTGHGRGRDARAQVDVNINGAPRGTRVDSQTSGDGMDFGLGVGYAWGQ